MAREQTEQVMRDFFVSFTGADRPWATWLVAELEAAGYRTVSQLREFVAGGNFMADMRQAAASAQRTLGVLSAHALQSGFVQQEWNQRLAQDPSGQQRALVLVRVEECKPEELLGPVLYIDLVNLDEAAARQRLREEVAASISGRRSLGPVTFPGSTTVKEARNSDWRRATRRLLGGVVLGAAAIVAASPPASAATTATFSSGVLSVSGDAANNSIVISRNAAGRILVNNGAVAVIGGTPTVANTSLIRVFGQAGSDTLSLS